MTHKKKKEKREREKEKEREDCAIVLFIADACWLGNRRKGVLSQ